MARLLLISLLLVCTTRAWVIVPNLHWVPKRVSARFLSSNSNVEPISLASLTDHEDEGSLLSESIVRWLDAEWMPQEVHVRMGACAARTYVNARREGDGEIMSIMMRVASELDQNWEDFDADAFVNAWDVANYVSDYLTKRSGSEGCECSNKIY